VISVEAVASCANCCGSATSRVRPRRATGICIGVTSQDTSGKIRGSLRLSPYVFLALEKFCFPLSTLKARLRTMAARLPMVMPLPTTICSQLGKWW
jgi:hypothetical protein